MRCPSQLELPPPPEGKSGWPWTVANGPLPEVISVEHPWPVISIVTPSYNQGSFIEETIRSVLLQGYPNLEYIVIDGGSTDESVSILRKYEPWLTYWVSEPDAGQSDAINTGFARSTGEILGWLNSDDVYEPKVLSIIAKYFENNPECDLLYGKGWYTDEQSNKTRPIHWIKPFNRRLLLTMNFILQPATFWRRALWERSGGLDIRHHWAMDWEWLLRVSALTEPHYLPLDLARWRVRSDIKTIYGGWARRTEIANISRRYGGIWQPTYLVYQIDRMVSLAARSLGEGVASRLALTLLRLIPWILKTTVWRGRQLSEFALDKSNQRKFTFGRNSNG